MKAPYWTYGIRYDSETHSIILKLKPWAVPFIVLRAIFAGDIKIRKVKKECPPDERK